MTTLFDDRLTIALPTGTLSLDVEGDGDIAEFCEFAARANPKRGFLVVSKMLGRHLPTRPRTMRDVMTRMAEAVPVDLPGPIVFLGMAETATALGQGVFAAYRLLRPGTQTIYLQTSRQRVPDAEILASFEEGHSHATTHLVQVADDGLPNVLRQARSLVIVDDECSTGSTFVAAAEAMRSAMPTLERMHVCCITDWSDGSYLRDMSLPMGSSALLEGRMEWSPATDALPAALPAGANRSGIAPPEGMRSRTGVASPESGDRVPIVVEPSERILVLGDGEHSYEALLIAEEIEDAGGVAAVQCITRSPALLGHAMRSVSRFEDAYGSGVACYLYNMLEHRPDRILIAAEVVGRQVEDARTALRALDADVPVELVLCTYPKVDEGCVR